jgi:hypothetical protein
MNKLTLGFLVILIFLASCSPAKPIKPTLQPLASPTDQWSIKLTQSGGFSGVLLTVDVSSDGQLIAENQRTHKSVTSNLPPQTISDMKRLILNLQGSTGRGQPSGCADCFIYDLEVRSDGNNIEIHVDDVTIKDSGAQELISTLMRIRDGALQPNP